MPNRPFNNRRTRPMPSRNVSRRFVYVVFGLVALVIVVGVVFGFASYNHTEHRAACVVSDKDRTRVHDSNGSHSDARIYTDNCGTFVVKDSLLKRNFHSSDTYASIKVGKTYDFETVGWRIPFFSQFPNILSATETQ